MIELIDSHCHVDGSDFDIDRSDVLARAEAAGVTAMIVVGTGQTLAHIARALDLAKTQPNLYAAIGVHPHDAAQIESDWWETLETMCRHEKTVAVGESGLDYHYNHSPPETQQEAFRQHVKLAHKVGKPIVCHVRDAHREAAQILREENAGDIGGVIHCFTGNADDAKTYVKIGMHISFSGIVTFKKAQDIRDAVKVVPSDRMLVETDAPFLAPIPRRGKRNEPAFVVHTAARVAEEAGLSIEELANNTTANTRALFGL